MMKKLVFFLSLLFALLPSETFGALSDYNIYFINGMDNEPNQAKPSRDNLRALVLSDVPDANVQNLYQRNTGSYWTMIERVRQMAIAAEKPGQI
jgi:hypothetical protein